MIHSNTQENKTWVKPAFFIVLFLILLPLVLFILVQFAPPRENTSSAGTSAENASGHSAATERHAQRTENRAARQEAKTTSRTTVSHGMSPDPEPMEFDTPDENISVVGVGAVVPNAPRSKRATPYPPGEVPGDSGVVVQYAGSPDDMVSGPQPPPPPRDDLWGGRPATPIPPANMRGIGGVRRVDPNDPFFQQDIPNPFNR